MPKISIVENCFDPELIAAAEAEWPDTLWPHWYRYDNGKLATHDDARIPPACKHLLIKMIEHGIYKHWPYEAPGEYFADWSFYGAGLHCMPSGSRLGTHLDSELHPNKKWLRAFSMVLHLNSVWDKSWGGRFYIQDDQHGLNAEYYDVGFNKLVTFKCTDQSYHGVEFINCPENMSRKTLAVFFWRKNTAADCKNLRTKAYFLD